MKPSKKNKDVGVVSGTIWSILDNATSQIITFVIFIILARFLNAEIYGVLAISVLVIQFFRNVIFDSISTSIVRKEKPNKVDYNTAFWSCVLFSLPAFLIVLAIAPWIQTLMGIKDLAFVIRWTALTILLTGVARTFEIWLTHNLMFKQLAIRSIISIIIGGLIGIYLAYKGYGVISLMAQQVVTILVSLIVLVFTTPWKPGISVSRASFKEMFNYGKHVSLGGVTNFANQNSDIFFISYFLGATPAGLYSVGKKLVNTFTTVLSSAFMRVSLPAFARVKSDGDKLRNHYLNATYFTILLTAPVFFGLSAVSYDVTFLVFGEKWIDAAPIMSIVSFVGCLVSIGYYNHNIMFACDKPQWQSRLTLCYAITNIIFFIIFVRFGIIATAIAFTLRTVLMYPLSVWCAITLINVKWTTYIRSIIYPLISASIMLFCVLLFNKYFNYEPSWLMLIVKVVIGALIYGASILLFLPQSDKSRVADFYQFIRNR
ncbi:TPA: lipopolysaccharide biosynthesis protein [Klebsiella pneumoniae]|nr:lipopolysaccharide biosynthesis protein [Klebsiella pneumoniae]HED4022122.1 lipopolysaccharide biosynthesis protein [Klebsiella pneumoniae]